MHCTRQDIDNTSDGIIDKTVYYTADNKGILHRIIYIQTNKHRKYYDQKRKNHRDYAYAYC